MDPPARGFLVLFLKCQWQVSPSFCSACKCQVSPVLFFFMTEFSMLILYYKEIKTQTEGHSFHLNWSRHSEDIPPPLMTQKWHQNLTFYTNLDCFCHSLFPSPSFSPLFFYLIFLLRYNSRNKAVPLEEQPQKVFILLEGNSTVFQSDTQSTCPHPGGYDLPSV